MYEMIREQMAQAVPFAAHVGVELLEVGPGTATAALEKRPETSNHVGTLHAGALFTLGETASGAAMTGAFAAHLTQIRPLAADARVSYLKVARGRVQARARTAEPVEDVLARFENDNRVRFAIDVTITDASDAPVCRMSVDWNVSLRSK